MSWLDTDSEMSQRKAGGTPISNAYRVGVSVPGQSVEGF